MDTRTRISKTSIGPARDRDPQAWVERTAGLAARGGRKDAVTPASTGEWDAKASKAAARRKG